VIVGVIAWKFIMTPIEIDLSNFDFNDLLALVMELFSIGLSVAFYFWTDQTANIFYDNTYKFTNEISEILGRIEAGFGERLRHLDEGYSNLSDRIEANKIAKFETQGEIEEREEKIIQLDSEKQSLLEELASREELQNAEKQDLVQKINIKDRELNNVRDELSALEIRSRRLEKELSLRTNLETIFEIENKARDFLREIIINEASEENSNLQEFYRFTSTRKWFEQNLNKFSRNWIIQARILGWLDSNDFLTNQGYITTKKIVNIIYLTNNCSCKLNWLIHCNIC
jgi:hypothetical protein